MIKSEFSRQSRGLSRISMDSVIGNKTNSINNNILDMCPNCETVQDGLPKYSSPLVMVQKIAGVDRKLRVVLKVYSTMYGLYAVVSQDRAIVKDCGYINLKTCTVLTSECDLTVQIIQRNCEGLTLTFKVSNVDEHKRLKNVLNGVECFSDTDEASDTGSDKEGSTTDSKLNKMWKRDISPRSPVGGRKSSLPALDEGEETEESEPEEQST